MIPTIVFLVVAGLFYLALHLRHDDAADLLVLGTDFHPDRVPDGYWIVGTVGLTKDINSKLSGRLGNAVRWVGVDYLILTDGRTAIAGDTILQRIPAIG